MSELEILGCCRWHGAR